MGTIITTTAGTPANATTIAADTAATYIYTVRWHYTIYTGTTFITCIL